MIIIWNGFGFLVAVITFGCLLVSNLIANAVAGEGYYEHHQWLMGVSFLAAAAICWFFGSYLRKRPGHVVIDKKTGEEITLRKKHGLFFIPMRWWGVILGVIALVEFVAAFMH